MTALLVVVAVWAFGVWYQNAGPGWRARCERRSRELEDGWE